MRVIENKHYEEPETEVTCPECGSRFAYNDSDIENWEWETYLHCPCCNTLIQLKYEKDDLPTIETIQYPKDFFSFKNGIPLRADEIDKWIKDCLNCLDKDNNYSCISSGDTIVFAYKSDEDSSAATVIVAKKYEEADVKIPRKNF